MTPVPAASAPGRRTFAPARLRVQKAMPGCSLQDAGRTGRLHEGIAASGPLVPFLHDAVRASLDLGPADAVLEVLLHPVTLLVESDGVLSVDGRLVRAAAGDTVRVDPGGRSAAYVGVPGGFDVPLVLGSRSTLPGAGVGGLEGRFLRAGDVLEARLAHPATERDVDVAPPDARTPIEVVPGPDRFPEGALASLLTGTWTVTPRFDRVGLRLDGPPIPVPADRPRSHPMRRGAIQVTLDGGLVVLGPDHPTTGGYPVIATVAEASFGALAVRRPGASVRFSAASADGPSWLERV